MVQRKAVWTGKKQWVVNRVVNGPKALLECTIDTHKSSLSTSAINDLLMMKISEIV